MSVIKTIKSANYVQIHNDALQNPELSLKAKGLLGYLMSLPEDWKIFKTELQKHFKDGRTAVENAWKELVEAGYAIQIDKRDEKGKFVYEYYVTDVPFTTEQISQLTYTEEEEAENVDVPVDSSIVDFPQRENRNGKPVTDNQHLQRNINKKTQTNKHKQINNLSLFEQELTDCELPIGIKLVMKSKKDRMIRESISISQIELFYASKENVLTDRDFANKLDDVLNYKKPIDNIKSFLRTTVKNAVAEMLGEQEEQVAKSETKKVTKKPVRVEQTPEFLNEDYVPEVPVIEDWEAQKAQMEAEMKALQAELKEGNK